MRLVIFGPPGSGKGTQAKNLTEKFDLVHLSTGAMFREAIREGTPTGRKAKEYMDRGELVPDEVVWRIAHDALVELDFERFILDGYPRTLQQAVWLDECLAETEKRPVRVLSLDLSADEVVRRLSMRRVHRETGESYHLVFNPPPEDVDRADLVQRDDDKPEAIAHRIEVYRDQTEPVQKHYESTGQLIHIDAMGTVEEVTDRIVERLGVDIVEHE